MFDQPCLVRICSGGFENWFSDKPDASLPAIFRRFDTEHSTYEVDSDVDEAFAVAAHQLTKPQQKLDTQCSLRIRYTDIEAIGLSVSRDHLGETGVIGVDHRHCDLLGDNSAMVRLASAIRELAEGGGSRPKV